MEPNIILLLLIPVFFFFIIRPQMKEKKAFKKLLEGLKKGDKILTNSGIYGEIAHIKDENRISLKIADNLKVDFAKSSVSRVLNPEVKK